MTYRVLLISFVFFLSASLTHATSLPLELFVSIPPQKNFVEKVGGKNVNIKVLLPPGQSPETYSPTPGQMADLSRSSLYFSMGVPFERGIVPKIRHEKDMPEIVDMASGIPRLWMNGDRHHGELDPHVWLAPENVKIMADNILKSLAMLDPENRQFYTENCMQFKKELDDLDKRLRQVMAPFKGRTIYVFHPAFGYFAAAYGIRQVAVETGGRSPSPRHVAKLIKMAQKDGVKAIFVQPRFPAKSARAIAASIGGAVIPIDPLAEDYLSNMNILANTIAGALK